MITWYMVGEEHDDGKSEYFKNIKFVEFHESAKTSFFMYLFCWLLLFVFILYHTIHKHFMNVIAYMFMI